MLNEAVTKFPGRVHWIDDDLTIATRGCRIFISHDGGSAWKKLFILPLSLRGRVLSSFRLTRRLLRYDVEHIVPLARDILLIAFGEIWIYRSSTRRIERVGHSIVGSRPLNVCKSDELHVYYGEYRDNSERSPVHVWGSEDGGNHWKPVHQFTTVRHVHGLYKDPYSDSIWITTGDYDDECCIWITENKFKSVEKVLGGSQQERCTTLLFTPDYVYFGTDSPLEQNYLYRFSKVSINVERLQSIGGPVLHGCKVGDNLFFSTDCEPGDVNYSGEAVVWCSNDGADWHKLNSFPKDIWHHKYFQYGQVKFPGGASEDNHLWITPYAVRHDQTSLKIEINRP